MDEPMEVDGSERNDVETAAVAENGEDLPQVGPNESGSGHPYAPENWPKPGDIWRWKVGNRIAKGRHHMDRYLYAPQTCPRPRTFASKKSLQEYIQKEFPDTDIDAFLSMFSWKIPARDSSSAVTDDPFPSSSMESPSDMEDGCGSESQTKCPAGKKFCNGLLLENQKAIMPCNICCVETGFCRHCSCILCCKNVRSTFGGYSFFKCEPVVSEAYRCGHVAHLDCALRCYMAGTVGGVFNLDAAYYCRRCDKRSDLIPHVSKFEGICKSINSGDSIKKILKLGICILRESQRAPAQTLLRHIETAFAKLNNGTTVEDIWGPDNILSVMPLSAVNIASDMNIHTSILQTGQNNTVATPPKWRQIDTLKLEYEINKTLQSRRKSHEAEYKLAEERLYSQKNYLTTLQEQLDYEKSQLAARTSSIDSNALLDTILDRIDLIKRELKNLGDMEEVAKGFRKVPRDVVDEHFSMDSD